MNTMTNRLSVSMEVLLVATHRCCSRINMSGYVDKSSPWNSESASHAKVLAIGSSSSSFPLFFPSSPCPSPRSLSVQKSSKSHWIASFPSYFRSSSLPFPWYICPKHFPRCVLFISPHHVPLPVRHSLSNLPRSMHHPCCPS